MASLAMQMSTSPSSADSSAMDSQDQSQDSNIFSTSGSTVESPRTDQKSPVKEETDSEVLGLNRSPISSPFIQDSSAEEYTNPEIMQHIQGPVSSMKNQMVPGHRANIGWNLPFSPNMGKVPQMPNHHHMQNPMMYGGQNHMMSFFARGMKPEAMHMNGSMVPNPAMVPNGPPAPLMVGSGPNPAIPPEVLSQVMTPPAGILPPNGSGSSVDRRTRRPFKPSTVWDHFLRLSDGNVQCVHCAKILKRKDSSTKTMWGHLRAIHYKGQDWTALQQAAANRSPSTQADTFDPSVEEVNISGTTQSWLEEQLGISGDANSDPSLLADGKEEKNDSSSADGEGESNLKRALDADAGEGTPTQPYVKRNRSMTYFPTPTSASDTYGSGSNANKCQPNNGLNAVRAALAQQQKSSEENKTMNFLAMIPRSSEIINITAGYSGEEESKAKSAEANGSERRSVDENGEAANNDSTNSLVQTRPSSHQAGGSPSVSSTNNQHQTAPFLSAAANNPFMYMAAAGAMAGSSGGSYPSGKISSTFSLMDGECVTTLMRVAADLDCTFLFHCRGGQPHFCFEPNVCAADKLRGPELSIVDLDHEIRVTERNGGVDVDSEMWKKTDWTQFTWAIRGKCQKALSRR